jgi:hypothetical protein
MLRTLLIALLILIPASTLAAPVPASFSAGRTLLSASSSPGNAYALGISVVVTAPSSGDLTLAGGTIRSVASIAEDATFLGGSIISQARIGGDLRAVGGHINIEQPIGGDLIAFGLSISASGRPEGSLFIGGANVTVSNGAQGPATVYGNNVFLDGEFGDDVKVFASGRVRLSPTAVIHGALSYEAPEPADIPASAVIDNGVTYTNATYLPDPGTSRTLALLSVGFFLFVRVLGALILAGLLAGLFPKLAEAVTDRLYTRHPRDLFLTTLLGFGILVATPVLILLLLITFVGMGLALFLFILYTLLMVCAVMFAGILLGSAVARRFRNRTEILWRDGVIGMLIFSLIALVPGIGFLVLALLTTYTAGALLQLFFAFIFPQETP